MKKILIRVFISIAIVLFLTPFAILGYYLYEFEYDLSALIDYNPPTTTRIYDANGDKLANLFEDKHRYYAKYEEIPPRMIEALIAIEDTTFFEHPGINIDAIFRAGIKVIKARKAVEGASTITQQLVKNVLLTREKKLSRKIKEAIYALKIERVLSKEQILERYLNEIYYGHGYYGVKTAADGYFHKKLSELTLKEMALLVGLPKAPSTYAPTRNYEISLGRANRVLERMYVLGWIDELTYQEAIIENPKVYDDTLTQNRAPFIVDEVMRQARKFNIDDIKSGGYEIYTTINLNLQDAARESLQSAYRDSLERIDGYSEYYLGKKVEDVNVSLLNGAIVSVESKTGAIVALVGSVDYTQSPYNRATQVKRQPGSAFKPFVYQVAIDMGYSGASTLVDIARTYTYEKNGEEHKWQPRNYEKNYKGIISFRDALIYSRNLATINLVNEIGLTTLLAEFDKFGIEDLPRDLSISLGTISLSPLDLAKYFTSFGNDGVQLEPYLVTHIEKNDERIYEWQIEEKRITSPEQSYIMTSILRDVVTRGTGRRARAKGIELAGKTGTTNNNVDGWFAGYSPTIGTIVWFGNDDNSPMHPRETGGKIAGPAFSMFYTKLLELYPQVERKFKMPSGIRVVEVDGKKEYFSDISKPPRKEIKEEQNQQLIF